MANELKIGGLFHVPDQAHAPTSIDAGRAARPRANQQLDLVIAALGRAGTRGLTDEELHAEVSAVLAAREQPETIKESSCRRARIGAMHEGLVVRRVLEDGEASKRLTTQGAKAQVWILAALQEAGS